MGGPLLCPILIGREAELALLRADVERLAAGRGGVALVVGQAGVGKSRLIADLLATPEAAVCVVVRAACLEPDRAEPYALILELAHAAAGSAIDLPIGGAPEAERQVRRVQQALWTIFERAAGGRPLLLVAEDLHWSDGPSLDVLLGLAQRPGSMLIVLTCRSGQPPPALAACLAELNRRRVVREVALRPLGRAEVARMVAATLQLDSPAPGILLDEVMAATDGNPFMVEEMLRALVESGGLERQNGRWRRTGAPAPAPGSLAQAIGARLARLPAEVTRVAVLAAVIGQAVDLPLLRRMGGLDDADLLRFLRALMDAQVIEQRSDGALAFRHALTREAVLARLLEPERQALHRRVAEIIETDSAASSAALAFHWSHGGEATRAVPYALTAGQQAAALHAHREAIVHYEVALAGQAAPPPAILIALGDQHAALNEIEGAAARYDQARARCIATRDAVGVAEIDYRMGIAYAGDRRRQEAQRHLATAFAGLPSHHPSRWQAGLRLALQLAALGEYAPAEATLTEALHAVEATNLLARLRVAYELGGLRALRGDWAALDEAAEAALRHAWGDTDEILGLRHDAHAALGTVAYYRGSFATSVEHFTACRELAERRGLVADQAVARWNLATNALFHLGRWPEARGELGELQAFGSGALPDAARWFEHWLDGRWEAAAEAWLRGWPLLEASADLEVLHAHGRRVADLLFLLGRHEQARSFLAGILERIRARGASGYEVQLAPREAEALARLEDPRAETVCESGLALARRLGARPAEGLLLRARALTRRAAGAWPEAFADWEEAIAILSALPMPYEAARTLHDARLGRLARGRRGDRERAAEHLRAAQRLFADIGAGRDEAATSGVLAAAGLAERPDRRRGPLSAREWEVAELVATGCSNREIADRLFITEKTAAYHVGAILTKLDFTTRSQIAAHIARQEPHGSG